MLLLILAGCSSQTASSRALWLRQALVSENTYWLVRSPDGLADKYGAMAADPYDYMRGSAGTWYADVARLSRERTETALLDETTPILLIGDAHPENLSTTVPGVTPLPTDADPVPDISLEIIDLDAATFGPWLLDLRRSALSLRVEADPLPGCDDSCIEAAISELVEEYIDGALGEPAPTAQGSIIENLIAEATAEGQARKKYFESTVDPIFDALQLQVGQGLDDNGVGIVAVTDDEKAQVDRLMAQYEGPEGFRVIDAARRYGTGISSRPAVRYLVLWDLGDDSSDLDNGIITIRETADPPLVPGLFAEVGDRYYDNAQRIEAASDLLWSTPDADPRAAAMTDGELAFKVLTWSSWFQDADHLKVIDDWEDGDIDAGDFMSMAGVLGHTLGSAHRRGITADGEPAAPVLEADIAGNEARLLAEILDASASDFRAQQRDYAVFNDLLDEHGPLLGADQIARDLP